MIPKLNKVQVDYTTAFSILPLAKPHLRKILGWSEEREGFICLHSKRIHTISEVLIRERL